MQLRRPTNADLDMLAHISLVTGNASQDATPLHTQYRLIGEIYSLPYAVLLPHWMWVAEDAEGVVGFVCGAPDTRQWEATFASDWAPSIRNRYPDKENLPSSWTRADRRELDHFYDLAKVPKDVVTPYPAHMHMNLLPRARGAGLGRQLFTTFLDQARREGTDAIHVGTSIANDGGRAFWQAMGFSRLASQDRSAIWLGRSV